MSKFADLSITELKTKLVAAAKETKEAMAEMLYYLREAMPRVAAPSLPLTERERRILSKHRA